MSYQASTTSGTSSSGSVSSASNYFAVGAELLAEVQKIIGQSRIKAIRLNLGGRQLKEVPVNPATAIATILIVIAAVIISNLRVEVVKEAN